MEKKYREYYWKRLDNAAKAFSAISNKKNTNVYRLSAVLREEVIPDLLQQAVERTLVDIPSFCVKQRKGFFWYYLESNFSNPLVQEERTYPCLRIERIQNNGYLFRTSYFGRKISLEIFHSLTDGTGALMFLRRLLYHYLTLAHPDRDLGECPLFEGSCHPNEFEEDSFIKNYSRDSEKESHTTAAAFRLRGPLLERRVTRVITGVLPVRPMLALCKSAGATVTEYMTALLLRSIYLGGNPKFRRDKPIVICIPVNLRSFYQSHTLCNFFSYLNIGMTFDRDYTFEEVLERVKKSFKEELCQERLAQKLRYNVEAERNLLVRFIPLFIKRIGLRVIHRRGERGQSCALSNLGVVTLPQGMQEFVERMDLLVSISSLKPVKAGMVSLGDRMSFTFTNSLVSADVQQYFFSFLAQKGIDCEIVHNEI
ncbi:hypothetical protein DW086_07235 [Harryflintia acetispora]|nr:hypothetical protein DW086_07235 [Harryflintia acetispora]